MKSSNWSRCLAVGISVFTTASVLPVIAAQERGSSSPYLGSVTGSEVNIRTGGSKNNLIFGSLRKGQKVIVEHEENGWCRIWIPRWIPVYVHKDYVESRGANGAIVKAGSLNMRAVPQKKSADEVVGTVGTGTALEVLAKEGDWVRVVPPQGAYCFVSKQFIGKERDIASGEAKRLHSTLEGMGAIKQASHEPAKGDKPARPPIGPEEDEHFSSSAIAKGNFLVNDILKKDPEEQDFSIAKKHFQELIANSEDRSEVKASERRLREIDDYEARAASIVSARRLADDTKRKNEEIDNRLKNGRLRPPPENEPFVARGWVTELGRFNGQQATHRLMKGNQVLYYMKSEDGNLSLSAFLNKRVGVKGNILELDPTFGAKLIVVKEIVVLSDL